MVRQLPWEQPAEPEPKKPVAVRGRLNCARVITPALGGVTAAIPLASNSPTRCATTSSPSRCGPSSHAPPVATIAPLVSARVPSSSPRPFDGPGSRMAARAVRRAELKGSSHNGRDGEKDVDVSPRHVKIPPDFPSGIPRREACPMHFFAPLSRRGSKEGVSREPRISLGSEADGPPRSPACSPPPKNSPPLSTRAIVPETAIDLTQVQWDSDPLFERRRAREQRHQSPLPQQDQPQQQRVQEKSPSRTLSPPPLAQTQPVQQQTGQAPHRQMLQNPCYQSRFHVTSLQDLPEDDKVWTPAKSQSPLRTRVKLHQPQPQQLTLQSHAGGLRSPSRSRRNNSIEPMRPRRHSNPERPAQHVLRGPDSNPFKLRRFVEPHKNSFAKALKEIQGGKKSSCWMWFVIPTPPHIVDGVERGSCLNRRYALRTEEEGRAFLEFQADGVNLRENYLEIMIAVRDQLRAGAKASSLLGHFDLPKLMSSVTFFERITRDGYDDELHGVVYEVINLVGAPLSA